MNKYPIITVLLIAFIFSGCKTTTKSYQPQLSVSIAPQKYFIERLIGNEANVIVMIPAGASHATYSPTPGQLQQLSESLAYFKMGYLTFEQTWKTNFAAVNKNMKWFDLSAGINLIQGEHNHAHDGETCAGGVDPHTWTSPMEMKIIITHLKEYLTELFPEKTNLIEENYLNFMKDIQQLDERLYKLHDNRPDLHFMIFHPAYSYLARDYGFEQLTIEFEGKTPTPGRLKETIDQARMHHIKTIFIQKEFDKKNAEVIAKEMGANTIQVNPLSENWLNEMNQFIDNIELQ